MLVFMGQRHLLSMIKIIINDYAVNTYIINENKEAYIIDPGSNFIGITEYIDQKGFVVKGVLLTHGHFDHIISVNQLIDKYQTKVAINEKEKTFLFDPSLNLSNQLPSKIIIKNQDNVLTFNEKTKFKLGNNIIKVLETPGHTKGSVCFKYKNFLFSGDTLFKGTIGRTDLPTSNTLDIQKSIRKIVLQCSDKTVVYPGHGGATTILKEKATNPFIKG